ncbi:MAG: alpha/beta fold hydrolase [Acidimicrobiales bacterium]|jgi:2-succinyl-6-hydroxy-2,4-cyclohexadiene-1-carboxylate synthase
MSFDKPGPPGQRQLELHATRQGRGPRVALVHGFTQTGSSWARVAQELESEFEVVMPDLPGHGRSPLPGPGPGLPETARALGEACGKAGYVGYSLGGRCCLHLALQSPGLVQRLVVVGAHPGIREGPARRLRRAEDDRRAAELERGGDATVADFVEAWLAGPLFAHLSDDEADRPSRLANTAAGLAASLRSAGTGTQAPLWGRLRELEMPVLVVAGELDEKFRTLAEATADAIGPNAQLAIVAGAGHAVCFERPDAFVEIVRAFLDPGAHASLADVGQSPIPKARRAPNTS